MEPAEERRAETKLVPGTISAAPILTGPTPGRGPPLRGPIAFTIPLEKLIYRRRSHSSWTFETSSFNTDERVWHGVDDPLLLQGLRQVRNWPGSYMHPV